MIFHRLGYLICALVGAAFFFVGSPTKAAPKPPNSPSGEKRTQQSVPSAQQPQIVELSIASRCGGYPGAQGLIMSQDGSLYGTSYGGGRFGSGFIFRLHRDAFSRPQKASQSGAPNEPQPTDFIIAHAFGDPRDQPSFISPSSLVNGADGKLYINGPTGDSFCIRFDPKSQSLETVKTDAYNSNEPDYTLTQPTYTAKCFAVDADGMLWCIGGAGVVFHTRGNSRDFGALKETRTWTSAVDGGDGYLYGTTLDSIERIKKDGSGYAVLHRFNGSDNGTTEPVGRPVHAKDGAIYGYAHPDQSTGQHGGILYKVNTDGTNFSIVQSLSADPDGILFASGKCIYGVSERGFYQVCDPTTAVALIAPSRKQHHLKAMAFDDKFAYALADADSIFRISLPSSAPPNH